MRIFCTPGASGSTTTNGGDNILITPPTYGMYKVCAKVNDVQIISVPLTPDFDLNVPKVRKTSSCIIQYSYIFVIAILLISSIVFFYFFYNDNIKDVGGCY